jgi:hypothetical protein
VNPQAQILARFSGVGEGAPLYLPDLTLWYDWHHRRGTLPSGWQGYSLPQVARALGVPVWLPVRPWRIDVSGAAIERTEQAGERVIRAEMPSGVLVARWTLGPDGDWWQTEYPVKAAADLAAALELVQARSYVLETDQLAPATAMVGEEGIVALEIPRRPLSDLLHEFLGWSEGLMLLGEPAVRDMLALLEEKLQHLVQQIAQLPGPIVFSPDNLDGQFISPRMFAKNLAESYRTTSAAVHAQGKWLVVHVGGSVRHLLAPLAAAGVDGLEGLAGPPQSDAGLAEARAVVGPDLTLWGGISQDFLLEAYDRPAFEAAVHQAAREARGDKRIFLGVADRVPVDAELSRLEEIRALIQV